MLKLKVIWKLHTNYTILLYIYYLFFLIINDIINPSPYKNITDVNNTPKKKTMSEKAGVKPLTKKEKEEAMKDSTGTYAKNAKPGSLAAKANLVKEYNEKNNK